MRKGVIPFVYRLLEDLLFDLFFKLRFTFLKAFLVLAMFFLVPLYIFLAKGRMAPSGFPGFCLHNFFTKSLHALIYIIWIHFILVIYKIELLFTNTN